MMSAILGRMGVVVAVGWMALVGGAGAQTAATQPANSAVEIIPAGKGRALSDGKTLAGWRKPTGEWMQVGKVGLDPANSKGLVGEDGEGVLLNGKKGRTRDLLTQDEFGDIAAHIEFLIPAKSNSGIYFMGRYEVQVYDSFGVKKDEYPGIECGGIYARWINNQRAEGHSPRVNASLRPGEWQSFDVVFQAPRFNESGKKIANAKFVKVIHNGQVIHENVEVTGPTRASAFNDEKPTGPLQFQGDHGPVAYRNLRVMPMGK